MLHGCLVAAHVDRKCTAGRYPMSGRYQATKALSYVSMAMCLDTVTSDAPGYVNNEGFGIISVLKS